MFRVHDSIQLKEIVSILNSKQSLLVYDMNTENVDGLYLEDR